MAERRCEFCGKPIVATRGNKRFCDSSCRARASMRVTPAVDVDEMAREVQAGSAAVDVLRAELAAAGVAGSSEAALAVLLAEIAADASQPAAGRVAAAKEARAAKDAALASAVVASPMDEVARRRDAKLRAARGS